MLMTLGWLVAASAPTSADPFDPAFTIQDLDIERCGSWEGQRFERADSRVLPYVLGLAPRRDEDSAHWYWKAPGGAKRRTGEADYHFQLVFKRPIAIGSVLSPSERVLFLRPDATPPGDPATAADWLPCEGWPRQSGLKSLLFPPGTTTFGVLCSFPRHRGEWPPEIGVWHFFRSRLLNVAPVCLFYASEEYPPPREEEARPGYGETGVAALQSSSGRVWENSGPDRVGINRRAPIDALNPVWVTLAWPEAQELVGLFPQGECGGFLLNHFAGPEEVPPAAGTPREWKKLQSETHPSGILRFQPVRTRGLRLAITKGSPADWPKHANLARLWGIHAYADLGDRPVPPTPGPDLDRPCPFRIPLEMPFEGPLAMVIDDARGRRVRNLLADVTRPAGSIAEPWDGKNLEGQYVTPGTYAWKAITSRPLELHYEFTAYPNNVKDHPPWITSHAGPGGWLADHSPPDAVCTAGDRVWLGSPVVEAGISFIECDLSGRKLAGWHSFGAFAGPRYLASDGRTVFIGLTAENVDSVWGYDPRTREVRTVLEQRSTERRACGLSGLAARDGLLYLSVRSGPAHPKFGDAAASAGGPKTPYALPPGSPFVTRPFGEPSVDIDHCIPRYLPARQKRFQDDVVANPRGDFVRLFRLAGTPPGRSVGLVTLESGEQPGRRQHAVLALKAPQPIGSAVFPAPQLGENLRFCLSILKPDGGYPPDPNDASQWTVLKDTARTGWDVVPFPPGTMTRAVRLTWERTDGDPLAEVVEGEPPRKRKQEALNLEDMGVQEEEERSAPKWKGVLEGMTFLRRRFENLMPSAAVRVNSGDLRENGEWYGSPAKPLSLTDPGIYLIEWKKPVRVRGLAVKEIHGQTTEIDVFTGPPEASVDLEGDAHWRKVATYEQPRRIYYSEAYESDNGRARYLDGLVDFGEEVETRAVRLRIVQAFQAAEGARLGVREDLGGITLDPRLCRVLGVAPLGYLGGESPVDTLEGERIAVYDEREKHYVREIAIERPDALAFGPGGELYALSGNRVVRVNVDAAEDASAHAVLVSDLELPQALAVDAESRLYVFDAAPDQRVIRVYSARGDLLRVIGSPGGRVAGPWDPTRFLNVTAMAVDQDSRLWVVELAWHPKRISRWTLDGQFLEEFLGPGEYGGGGVLDPRDKTRLYYKGMEFELEWEKGNARLKNLLWLPRPQFLYMGSLAGEIPLYLNDRQYMVTRGDTGRQTVAAVHVYEKDRLRMVAALGAASHFPPLKTPRVLNDLGGPTLSDHAFLWSDANGDAEVQAAEVVLKDPRFEPVGLFQADLSIMVGKTLMKVKAFHPGGAPLWEEEDFPGIGSLDAFGTQYERLPDGNFFILGLHNGLLNPAGEILWKYKTTGVSVGGTPHAPPYTPGQVAGEFNNVCHPASMDAPASGDLGPFEVHSSNAGVWNLWTHDGLLAGRLFQDVRTPQTPLWCMEAHHRGLRLDGHTLSAEHFSGYLCRTADGRYYAVAGFNHASLVEIRGLDTFRRLAGRVELTPRDLQQLQQWEAEQAKHRRLERPKIYDLFQFRQKDYRDWDNIPGASFTVGWDPNGQPMAVAEFRMAYDAERLYLRYEVRGLGPLANQAGDWRMLFKTGASVDLQLGTDAAAPRGRRGAVPGDLRLLITLVDKKPMAVLYLPDVPGTPPEKAYQVVSPVASTTIDVVRRIENLEVAATTGDDGYHVEAAVPLAEIGFRPKPGERYRFDWGLLSTDTNASACTGRLYWSNKATSVLADAPTEARLAPNLWGDLRVLGAPGRGVSELQDLSRMDSEGREAGEEGEAEAEFEE
ncbi:MAG: hypothetical protein HYU36_00895 [Planctomycetes bacterium]|nr:hypothetical protein [Planctomycetota bacterium]